MRMTEDEYKALIAKITADSASPLYKNKRDTSSKAQGTTPNKREKEKPSKKKHPSSTHGYTPKYRIVVIAKKVRPIDPDGIFAKWEIDELVRAGVIPDDSCTHVTSIEKRVELVFDPSEESTIIEVWEDVDPPHLVSSSLEPIDDI